MMPRKLAVQFKKFWSLDDDIWIGFDKRRKLNIDNLVGIIDSIHIDMQKLFVIDVEIGIGRTLYVLRIYSQRRSISLDKRSLSSTEFSAEKEMCVLRCNI